MRFLYSLLKFILLMSLLFIFILNKDTLDLMNADGSSPMAGFLGDVNLGLHTLTFLGVIIFCCYAWWKIISHGSDRHDNDDGDGDGGY